MRLVPGVYEQRMYCRVDPLRGGRRSVRNEAPRGAVMSAWEVLSWIAFNEIRQTTLKDDFKDLVRLCADDSPPKVMEALKARAALEAYRARDSASKYQMVDGHEYSYKSKALSRETLKLLRQVMWRFRRLQQRPVRLAELVDYLTRRLANQLENERRLTWARLELREAIVECRIPSLGRKWRIHGDEPEHEAVSPHVVAAYQLIVTDWGTVARTNVEGAGYYYRDVRFFTSDVLTFWPPRSNAEGLPPELESDPKAVEAFAAMLRHQKVRVEKRDPLARIIAKETGCTVRLARGLYRHLPKELRNPARKLQP
jgi:hypothetical protein